MFNNPMNNFMFTLAPVFIIFIFIIVFTIIILVVVKGLRNWSYNNAQPVLTVPATVVAKRTDVRHSSHTNGDIHHSHHSNYTYYYVTFEVESGDRMELAVAGDEYGLLVEGDNGRLTFQGTRYLGFQRER